MVTKIQLIKHAPGAPGLRLLGLGPNFKPCRGITKLKQLLSSHAFWATERTESELRRMLQGSTVVISIWNKSRMVGFGRATSDGIYRAVLWDIVVADDLQGLGLGKRVVKALLENKSIKEAQRIYLMTSSSQNFYSQLNFQKSCTQELFIYKK